MTFGFWAQRRKASARQLDQAAQPVIETLEGRLLLSGATHPVSHFALPTSQVASHHVSNNVLKKNPAPVWSQPGSTEEKFAAFPAPVVGFSGPPGFTPQQIRQTYDLNTLDAYNPSFPLYTNTGANQVIVIIGAPASGLEGYYGNLAEFNRQFPVTVSAGGAQLFYQNGGALQRIVAAEPLTGVTTSLTDPYGDGVAGINISYDNVGAVETTMAVQWASAMAPAATIYLVEVNSVGGVVQPADLRLGIQKAIDILNPGSTNPPGIADPLNPNGGGVVSMSVASAAEDAATLSQYDALFSEPQAQNISFIAPSGDNAGARSMPAVSPHVTAVGGTVLRTDVAGTRQSETAWLYTGGGESALEPRPAFQNILKNSSKALKNTSTGRLVPDISLVAAARASGLSVYYDPIPSGGFGPKNRHYGFSSTDPYIPSDHGVNSPWANVTGTSISAPLFAGMVADANELRDTLGQTQLGQTLNQRLYDAFAEAPTQNFTDITVGNNAARGGPGHQTYPGYDLASGLGAPDANFLLPALAGVIGSQRVNLLADGTLTLSIQTPVIGNAVFAFRSTGAIATIGPENVGITLNLISNNRNVNGVLNLPFVSRNIDDGSINGTGTFVANVTTNTGGVISITQKTVNVGVSGFVTGSGKRSKVKNGRIFTIDSNGNPVSQGAQDVFQGVFYSVK